MHGIWQLARQTLTADARGAGSHATRFGLAVVLYLAVTWASFTPWRSAAGLPLFHAQLLITAFYLTINAIFGFSQAITEEKEDGTLGLLRLADVSSLSILLGKMAGRLADAGLMLALQFPFTIVAITLGGVSWAQVVAAYAALAVYLWLLATLGIAASVLQPTGAAAARWTAVLVGLYTLPPYAWMFGRAGWLPPGWAIWFSSAFRFISLPLRLNEVTESSFDESAWCAPIGFGLIVGSLFLLAAWWAFDRMTLVPETVRPAIRWPTFFPTKSSRFHSRRAWERPVIWREFVFLTGGVPWLVLRTSSHWLIVLAMIGVQDTIGHIFVWASIFSGLFALIDGTWSASRLFRDEIRDRTWSSLVQTPHGIARLAFDKFCGWMLGMSPAIVFPYVFILTTIAVHENTNVGLAIELVIGSLTVGVSVFAYLHLLVLMSLHFGWKATPLTLTVSFAAAWVYVQIAFEFGWDLSERCAAFGATCVALVLVMAALQFLIVRRLRVLAETA